MKIEYNSAPLTSILGTGLDKAFREQLPDKISAVCSKKVKLLQFYKEISYIKEYYGISPNQQLDANYIASLGVWYWSGRVK